MAKFTNVRNATHHSTKNQVWTDIKAHQKLEMGLQNTSVMIVKEVFALESSCKLILMTI